MFPASEIMLFYFDEMKIVLDILELILQDTGYVLAGPEPVRSKGIGV